jgi:putative two-component system response regulator
VSTLSTTARDSLQTNLIASPIVIINDGGIGNFTLQQALMSHGFENVHTFFDPAEAKTFLASHSAQLMIIDTATHHPNGIQLIAEIRHSQNSFPKLLLTAHKHPGVIHYALGTGATMVLEKPANFDEVVLAIKNFLKSHSSQKDLEKANQTLIKKTLEQSDSLKKTQLDSITRLALVAEFRNPHTKGHIWRVAKMSYLVALELNLGHAVAEQLLRAARLHDVGKVAVPDHILFKSGPLTPEEYEVIKTHTTAGAQLLYDPDSEIMTLARNVALTHHERWDGLGYPNQLKGDAIPLEGQIVAVADAFDIMTQDQLHRKGMSLQKAFAELESQKGQQFSPRVIEAFIGLLRRGEVPVIL